MLQYLLNQYREIFNMKLNIFQEHLGEIENVEKKFVWPPPQFVMIITRLNNEQIELKG